MVTYMSNFYFTIVNIVMVSMVQTFTCAVKGVDLTVPQRIITFGLKNTKYFYQIKLFIVWPCLQGGCSTVH